jgi:hypothetical protein
MGQREESLQQHHNIVKVRATAVASSAFTKLFS